MNLERLILEQLSRVHPRMKTRNVLWSDLRIEDSSVSLSATDKALRDLESKGQVVVIATEDATKIKITTDGLARLAE